MTQFWTWGELHALLDNTPGITPDLLDELLDAAPPGPQAFNVCPSQEPLVIRSQAGRLSADRAEWGIRSRAPSGSTALVSNARSETVDTKPLFRDAFHHARCLVPANGFYEWEPIGPREKQPWYFTPQHQPLCFFAGIIAGHAGTQAMAVITADTPEHAHTKIHHRMPCVVMPEHAAAWLGLPHADPIGPRSCLRAFGSEHAFPFTARPVSKRVNKVGNDDADLIEPVEPDRGLFG